MAQMHIKFYSTILQLMTTVNVIVPDSIAPERPPAVLYLLHGLGGDADSWLTQTPLVRYVGDRQLIVIMPEVHRSFYADMICGNHYWTYLTNELPQKIKTWFPLTSDARRCFVAGLSMGGYGALKWGLNEPEKFVGIASMSGAVDIHSAKLWNHERPEEFSWIFGADVKPASDLFALVDRVSAVDGRKPEIIQFCGSADFLYEENQRFKTKLDSSTLPHRYIEKAGAAHEWSYWDQAIQTTLNWIEQKS